MRDQSPGLARFTTVGLLSLEEQILSYARHGFGGPVPAATAESGERVLAARPELSDEQRAMVRAVCMAAPPVQPVAGRPGAGKTYATAACVDALVDSGVPVVGCSVSAVAAAELEAATQLSLRTGRPASTIARLLLDSGRSGLPPRCVLIIDEASMTGTRDLARLLDHVARAGGAAKLIGDPDQHGPVETGGVFRRLVHDLGDRAPRLVHNNRQLDAIEREAVERYRQEMVDTALAKYEAEGKVVRAPDAARCYEAMIDDWFAGVRAGINDPMIAGTNSARRTLNDWARTRLKREGLLSGPTLTVAEREFCAGDWVVTRKNARHLRSSQLGRFVKNGSSGVVVAVDGAAASLVVDFADEGRIVLPAEYLGRGFVEHGYARTTYLVQGATLHRALYHPTDVSSFEEGYVALTRGRHETRIYIVDGSIGIDDDIAHAGHERDDRGLDTVCEALERRRSRRMALDTDPAASRRLEQFRGWTLDQLRAERDRLEATLAEAPPSVDEDIAEITSRLDALRTRRDAWGEVAGVGASRGPGRLIGRRRRVDDAVASARHQVAYLDRTIQSAADRLHALAERAAERDRFLTEHDDEVDRLRLVRRAELARELTVRAAASPSEVIPSNAAVDMPVDSGRWRAAVERAAVDLERFGTEPGDPTHRIEGVLGGRPDDARAAWSYERAAEGLRLAFEPDVALPDIPEPDLLPV